MSDIDKWRSLPPITYTDGKWSDDYAPPDPSSRGGGFLKLDSFPVLNEDEVAAADRFRFMVSEAHRFTTGLPKVQRIFDIAEFNVGAIRGGARREGVAVLGARRCKSSSMFWRGTLVFSRRIPRQKRSGRGYLRKRWG